MTTTPDVRETGRRVEQLLDSLASSAEPQLRMHAEELVRLLVALYGAGLARIISTVTERLDAERPDGADRFADLLTADELVSGLLVLHGLHPHDIQARVRSALDESLPALGLTGAEVELVGVDDAGVVRLRWTAPAASSGCGSGGCGSAATGVPQQLVAAIMGAVADVTAVDVREETAPPMPTLIPVESLFRDRPAPVRR